MKGNGYFDTKRDIAVLNVGGFFCQACLVGKPPDEMSPNPRYCQDCYAFLLKEARRNGNQDEGEWPKEQGLETRRQRDKASRI